MVDITMSLDDTLELDTIIEKSSRASKPLTFNSDNFSSNGIQTHTEILNPKESGTHKITINGQELTVKVTDPTNIPNDKIDRFEDGSLSEYAGGANWTVQQTTVLEGNNTAKGVTPDTELYVISSKSGLPAYPEQGYEMRFLIQLKYSDGGYKQTGSIIYGAQSESGGAGGNFQPNGYYINCIPANNSITVGTDAVDDTYTTISLSEFSAGKTYDLRLIWDTDNTHKISLLDLEKNKLGEGSFTDSTYKSGGLGFVVNAAGSGSGQTFYIDDVARKII